MTFAVALAALAFLGSLVGIGFGARAITESKRRISTSSTGAAPTTAPVTLSDFKITPDAVQVAAGGFLDVTNTGQSPHNLAVQGAGLATPMINTGATARLDVSGLAPGKYTLFCEVPGHADLGMKGTLTVVAGTGAGTGAAATTPTTAMGDMPGMNHSAMTADQMDAIMAKSIKAFPAATEGQGGQVLAPEVLPDGTKLFKLTAQVVQWEIEPGKRVEAWTYNGAVPGPTIKVNPGDKVQVSIHNVLPESTSIHFHGLITPNSQDGVPDITQDPIKPGQTYLYSFTAQSTPAVGMYHSHQDAVKQVPNGMAGAFLVGREPVPAGVTVSQEQTMMLNDAGTIGYSINGKSFPATAPVVAKLGDWVIVHYMNEGVMVHPMHLHGLAQMVIAKDGYPLAQPYEADTILVGPGERYTVLVHATEPGTWAWHCHILPHAERADGMFGMVTAMVVKG